jgi:spore coat polysaccharide biosynthesis protein SpsF (cytidylyltransferase family)
MSTIDKVLIAVQARTGNTRLPDKGSQLINGKTVSDRVVDAVKSSASYINNGKGNVEAHTCLLVPQGDPMVKKYSHNILTLQGSPDDVLSRYYDAAQKMDVDYIVRITGDCPMIPPFVITKHILCATKHRFDYVTNTREEIRTCPDGHDTEVISRRLIEWCNAHAVKKEDREHVTTYIKRHMPDWARDANIISYTDNSCLKLSIDTEEDLEFVRLYDDLINRKIKSAKNSSPGFFRI